MGFLYTDNFVSFNSAMKINREWHLKNKMPKNPAFEQRKARREKEKARNTILNTIAIYPGCSRQIDL